MTLAGLCQVQREKGGGGPIFLRGSNSGCRWSWSRELSRAEEALLAWVEEDRGSMSLWGSLCESLGPREGEQEGGRGGQELVQTVTGEARMRQEGSPGLQST